jgi:hypothetical protein
VTNALVCLYNAGRSRSSFPWRPIDGFASALAYIFYDIVCCCHHITHFLRLYHQLGKKASNGRIEFAVIEFVRFVRHANLLLLGRDHPLRMSGHRIAKGHLSAM